MNKLSAMCAYKRQFNQLLVQELKLHLPNQLISLRVEETEDETLIFAQFGDNDNLALFPIGDDMTKRIQELAVRAFTCLGCNGVVRFDFMIDEEKNELYLNEINTIPGSLSFYLWEPAGVSYPELLDRLIDLAMKRRRDEERVTFSFDTNILNQSSLSGLKGSKGSKL